MFEAPAARDDRVAYQRGERRAGLGQRFGVVGLRAERPDLVVLQVEPAEVLRPVALDAQAHLPGGRYFGPLSVELD